MVSWLSCLRCECDCSGSKQNSIQEAADASAPPTLLTTDDGLTIDPRFGVTDDKGVPAYDSEHGACSSASSSTSETATESESGSDAPEDNAQVCDKPDASKRKRSSPKKRHTAKLIEKGIGRFRKRMLTATGPGAVEHDRGVFIEDVYDFYDPVSAKVRARKMNEDVVHRRRGSLTTMSLSMIALPSIASASSANSEASSDSATSSGKTPKKSPSLADKGNGAGASEKSSNGVSQSGKSSNPGARLQRTATRTNLELVAVWGVFVGNMLHRRVVDFSALTDMMLNQKRYLAAQPMQANCEIKNSVQEKAGFVVAQAMKLAKRLKREQRDLRDGEWKDVNLLSYLFSTTYVDVLVLFSRGVAKLLHKQPTVAVASAPCHVFGDIHGQLRDLLLLFACFGTPAEKNSTSFVFNGDFVDRGAHQIEVIGLLFALKLWMPESVWLVRGNHEDREMNKRYGFKQTCLTTLGSEFGPLVFERIHQAFDELPLACLIEKKMLCVHGGLGDGKWTLEKLRAVKRPLKEVAFGKYNWLSEILWSDPIEDGISADPDVFGVHESPRGKSGSLFAWNVTKIFCARNGLSLIIRSHQSKQGSPGFDVMHDHLLVRVFSARDYEDHGNDGAILKIEKSCEDGKELLKIRAQVLRSVTKMRDEASRHQELGQSSSTSGSPRVPDPQEASLEARSSIRSRRNSTAKARRLSTKELMGDLA